MSRPPGASITTDYVDLCTDTNSVLGQVGQTESDETWEVIDTDDHGVGGEAVKHGRHCNDQCATHKQQEECSYDNPKGSEVVLWVGMRDDASVAGEA